VLVLLQGGGQGTRLRPYTDHAPKPMVPVRGVPLVERLFRHFTEHGFREFVVVVGPMGEQVESHLRGVAPEDVSLMFVREETPRGNVGALQDLGAQESPVLLAFADLLTDLDVSALVAAHDAHGNDLTLASHVFRDRMAFGELVVEGDRVRNYREKPERSYLICSGVFVASPRAARLVGELGTKVGLVDLVQGCLRVGLEVGVWHHESMWLDINSAEALQRAEELLAGDPPGSG
jgi:NDP-mannose synthase